ncbi:MAG TPA: hypothetical protein VMS22_01165 [Candidatus Eisenbacteria bacterium]|nr:hypothetical protein [Candidatus Eisenbacteria bacterium]
MPAQPGPGPVAVVHRITIVTALLGALAYTVWAISQGEVTGIAGGAAATAVTWLYLRNLRSRLDAKLRPGGGA